MLTRAALASLLVVVVILAGSAQAAPRGTVPFYCKRMKINCERSPSHACCKNVEPSTTTPEPVEVAVTDQELLIEEGSGLEEDYSETELEGEPPLEEDQEVLLGAPSEVDEVVVDPPEEDAEEEKPAEPVKYAPKFCLVLKFNCQLRATHPCCAYPLPARDQPETTTTAKPEKKTNIRGRPGLASNQKSGSGSASSLLRPAGLPFANKNQAAAEPAEDVPVDQEADAPAEAPQPQPALPGASRRPVRPNILRRPLPTKTSTEATSPAPIKSSPISKFKRPERPLVVPSSSASQQKTRPNPISSLAALRQAAMCKRLKVNCDNNPAHACCKGQKSEEETTLPPTEIETEEAQDSVEPNNESETDVAQREDSPDEAVVEVKEVEEPAEVEVEPSLEQEAQDEDPGSVISFEDVPDDVEEVSVVSKISSTSSTQTRIIQMTSPRKPSQQQENPEEADVPEENMEAEMDEEMEMHNQELEPEVMIDPLEDNQPTDEQFEAMEDAGASTPPPQPLYEDEEDETAVGQHMSPTDGNTNEEEGEYYYVYEYEETGEGRSDSEYQSQQFRQQAVRPVFVPAEESDSTSIQEEDDGQIPPDFQNQMENNLAKVAEVDDGPIFIPEDAPHIETETLEWTNADTTEGAVLDANQIAPRVPGECFRFDCLSLPQHECCLPARNTRKRQIPSFESSPPLSLAEILGNHDPKASGFPSRITATVTRLQKSINWGDER